MSIGQNIKRYRKQAQMSQIELAKASGLSIGTIQGYEQGRYVPKIDNIKKLADALNCTPDDLSSFYLSQVIYNNLALDPPSKRGIAIAEKLKELNEESALALFELFNELNEDGQEEALKRLDELTRLPEYKKAP